MQKLIQNMGRITKNNSIKPEANITASANINFPPLKEVARKALLNKKKTCVCDNQVAILKKAGYDVLVENGQRWIKHPKGHYAF